MNRPTGDMGGEMTQAEHYLAYILANMCGASLPPLPQMPPDMRRAKLREIINGLRNPEAVFGFNDGEVLPLSEHFQRAYGQPL